MKYTKANTTATVIIIAWVLFMLIGAAVYLYSSGYSNGYDSAYVVEWTNEGIHDLGYTEGYEAAEHDIKAHFYSKYGDDADNIMGDW